MSELKPCPFCGAPAEYTQYSYDHPSAPCTYHLVRCTKCCAKVETTTTAADAMKQWNRRPEESGRKCIFFGARECTEENRKNVCSERCPLHENHYDVVEKIIEEQKVKE